MQLYFIVMELVDGRSLAEVVRQKRLTPQEATRIITEASRGLAHAHRRGLIHRDIKPGNIMVTSEDQVKMTDFGLARDIFRDTSEYEEGRAVGTPLYMAPEQCEGEDGDSRSDVYSMGATYYVALTRRPPYEGRDTEEVMNRHRFDPPPDPRKVVPGLPAAVFRIIEKAMAKDPDKRYQTAGDLLGALEGLDFESLDPNATVNLEAVSAQIGAVTPQVGSHVGAVMKQAARRVDRSTSRIRMVETIEKVSPLKWYIIGGLLVALVCIAAVVLAIILAIGSGGDADNQTLKQIGTSGAAAVIVKGTKSQSTGQSTPPGDTQAETAEAPKEEGAAPKPEPGQQPTVAAAEPEPEEDPFLKSARETYERAKAYEKEAWATDQLRVLEVYQNIIDTYGNTEYARKAQADIDRLQGDDSEEVPEDEVGDD
ncbi:MAG: protein kinase [Anaerolineaceae bacterium]|nr:protein kinase [Anaerolineaceae bacterium]